MTSTNTIRSISLSYRDGRSDKVYHVQVVESTASPGTFNVTFQYGRRGSSLAVGSKTPTPVSRAGALIVYDRLVKEKTAKGYVIDAESAGSAPTSLPAPKTSSGMIPQLLNPIDEARLEEVLASPDWFMQQKFDGRRLMIRRNGSTVTGSNRKGEVVAISEVIERAILNNIAATQFVLDGEDMGDSYVAFDLLEHKGVDLRAKGFHKRYALLETMMQSEGTSVGLKLPVAYAPCYTATTSKRAGLENIKARKLEGVVFKKADAAHVPGRPNSGGNHLKFKFVESASVIVSSITKGKRSVMTFVFKEAHGGSIVQLGAVTIPSNHDVPPVGAIIEVEYLYAYKGGSLYQPVYKGDRTGDVDGNDCTEAQLKYKPEEPAAPAPIVRAAGVGIW